ncbi:MAG: lipopolysaccharide assembly protein LapA domain-containing protein [Parvibaculales bacterium]|jgi:uncharacterized membrane protein YciS (DUF1049 family)
MWAFLAKLTSRIIFIALVALLIPLAVQNRQLITLYYDPLAWMDGAESASITLPLFLILLMIAVLGFIIGWIVSATVYFKRQSEKKYEVWRNARGERAASENQPPVMTHLPDAPAMLEEPKSHN